MLQYVFRKGTQFLNNNVKKQHLFVAHGALSVAFVLKRKCPFTIFVKLCGGLAPQDKTIGRRVERSGRVPPMVHVR
jgi:hypothetical protein